jgi:hypothetical protein
LLRSSRRERLRSSGALARDPDDIRGLCWQARPYCFLGAAALSGISVTSPLSASPAPAAANGASRTGLQAQVARYEKERSACVNCASADTLQGKENIQRIEGAISTLRARLTAVPAADATQATDETRSSTAPTRPGGIDVYA